ncbi:acyltransferase domain-containing protein, partial [Actinomadura fibrosa]
VIARDHTQTLHALHALATHTPHPDLTHTRTDQPGKTVFVFPGQGPQWPGMAHDLLTHNPTFRHHIHQCADALTPYVPWSLIDLLHQHPNTPDLNHTDVVQPALFAVMIALARLWQHHGIHPDAVIGHSQGEIAAAHIAGALTLDDATKIIALRSQAIATHLTGHGAMLALTLPAHQTQTLINTLTNPTDPTSHPPLTIAAHNSPTHTIVSGTPQAIHHLNTHCHNHNIPTHLLPVTYASHHPQTDTIRTQLLHDLHPITPHPAHTPLYSTITTTPIDTTTLTPTYWHTNLRHPIHFHQTITTLINHGHTHYIEISPHPTLTTSIQHTLDTHHTPGTTTPTLHRNNPTHHHYLTNLTHHPHWKPQPT